MAHSVGKFDQWRSRCVRAAQGRCAPVQHHHALVMRLSASAMKAPEIPAPTMATSHLRDCFSDWMANRGCGVSLQTERPVRRRFSKINSMKLVKSPVATPAGWLCSGSAEVPCPPKTIKSEVQSELRSMPWPTCLAASVTADDRRDLAVRNWSIAG
jgi:hypothetical protein